MKSAHTDVRDYVCTWEGCDKSFATGTRLRRHLSAHEGREKYRCRGYDGCNETFRKHETLRKHILLVHEQIKPFPCENIDTKTGQPCTKSFETAEKLERHKNSQHDLMRFSCTDCLLLQPIHENNALDQNNFNNIPMLVGHGFFATYSELQAHIAEVHPPTCQYCPISFKTLKELTRHLEVQHGHIDPNTLKESAIACTFPGCGRQFTKKGNLMVHIKTVHEKKKDFVCGETAIPVPEEFVGGPAPHVQGCGRAFGTKATLLDHVRTAHFGLQSKVVQGRKKRKAERSTEGLDDEYHEPKKRAPRKDKGVPKTSAFAELTGMPASADEIRARLDNHLAESTYAFSQAKIADDKVAKEFDSDSDQSGDWDQMTSSMTLCGDNMYHNGRVYQYVDGQYSPGLHSPPLAPQDQRHARINFTHSSDNETNSFEDDAVFANFEHEPEYLSGPLDPILLRS